MRTCPRYNQQGMALFVSLVFLLLLTIVGLSAMQNASLQEKMAGNVRMKNESFQYAEAGLREGEFLLKNTAVTECDAAATSQGPDTSSVSEGSGTTICDHWKKASDKNSHYWIEKITVSKAAMGVPTGTSVSIFRVTAVSTVGQSTSVVESIYAKN